MHGIRVVYKKNKGWRFSGCLGRIIEFDASAPVQRGRILLDGALNYFIQLTGADAPAILLEYFLYGLKDFRHPLSGEGGNGQGRCKIQKLCLHSQLLIVRLDGVGVFFDKVPFIEQ